jgi:hypothetical protein
MSRLDSFIRRLEAQRVLLDWATEQIVNRSGLVLELGLGNGRTYDHLREKLPGRAIYAFDRAINANPRSIPPEEYLVLGDFADTLPAFARQYPAKAALIHSDAGLGDPDANARQVLMISRILPPLAASGALVLSDQRLDHPALQQQPLPPSIRADRYFIYRRI